MALKLPHFFTLAGVVMICPEQEMIGMERFQATMQLLQQVGFPTEFTYRYFFNGPWSDGLSLEIKTGVEYGLLNEYKEDNQKSWAPTASARRIISLDDVISYRKTIHILNAIPLVKLLLASKYDRYRVLGHTHQESLRKLGEGYVDWQDVGEQDKSLRNLFLPIGLYQSEFQSRVS